ncbi:hypothetical protein A2272_02825 [Candidatus Peregrinibacteria bacterium RIFOXYA12_FULL_33_12]|nr:MAG: hypothetical protein A2272_02825 [Candidatus Peregrinibacteria bacterium RIFOXYA12_FULL_33_12]OGJ45252.1 MAG: hypothetical protein A2263_06800 [Candidatus Peregrinibacteria bacterium RIFOXYA2_FULL_33_21]OGJ51176.1 MAG: hypothetical protein A2307_04885 [Candidatus Peregrinibacteria bacterium RIFOXYB2_FULL_33_20]
MGQINSAYKHLINKERILSRVFNDDVIQSKIRYYVFNATKYFLYKKDETFDPNFDLDEDLSNRIMKAFESFFDFAFDFIESSLDKIEIPNLQDPDWKHKLGNQISEVFMPEFKKADTPLNTKYWELVLAFIDIFGGNRIGFNEDTFTLFFPTLLNDFMSLILMEIWGLDRELIIMSDIEFKRFVAKALSTNKVPQIITGDIGADRETIVGLISDTEISLPPVIDLRENNNNNN